MNLIGETQLKVINEFRVLITIMSEDSLLDTVKVAIFSFISASIVGILRKYILLSAIALMPPQSAYNIEGIIALVMIALGITGFASLVICIKYIISFFENTLWID
ncbi:hypothetical protein [Metallosphaera hakonensis]|uniref:Uncharacterized protein n=2 Tax=Metallosphaera hakonensis TaxID=79601 RepID=A0A2U9IUY8_9CREN|nr:hypothetical protein [Metallosphaera hakonensis]AWR99869.1 hypothetical protein DFR87_09405 [Metallosphaera hakonensis JCM 8857 = DSM 7519]